jgi:hypothetical protein
MEWSDLQLVNIVVSLDTKKSRIVIYRSYSTIRNYTVSATEENDTDVVLNLRNNNGDDCTLSIITRNRIIESNCTLITE